MQSHLFVRGEAYYSSSDCPLLLSAYGHLQYSLRLVGPRAVSRMMSTGRLGDSIATFTNACISPQLLERDPRLFIERHPHDVHSLNVMLHMLNGMLHTLNATSACRMRCLPPVTYFQKGPC